MDALGSDSPPRPVSDGSYEVGPSLELATAYREHFDFVWRTLVRSGVDMGVAEDAAQEVFVVVHRRASSFRAGESQRAWIYGICRRVAFRYRRSRGRRERALAEYLECIRARDDIQTSGKKLELGLAFEQALARLDADKREAFVLSRLEGWTAREIATSQGVNPNTVAARVRAARDVLAREMEGHVDAKPVSSGEARHRQREARSRVHAALLPLMAGGWERPALAAGMGTKLGAGIVATGKAAAIGAVLFVGGAFGIDRGMAAVDSARAVTTRERAESTIVEVSGAETNVVSNPRDADPAREDTPARSVTVVSDHAVGAELPEGPATNRSSPTIASTQSTRTSALRTNPPRVSIPSPSSATRQERPRTTMPHSDAPTPAGGPRLRAGELQLAERLRKAAMAGEDAKVVQLAATYRERYAGGLFTKQVEAASTLAHCRLSGRDDCAGRDGRRHP